jgi:putative DNA primase/helicase
MSISREEAMQILDEAERAARGKSEKAKQRSSTNDAADAKIAELAVLSELAYQKHRKEEAKAIGISLSALDRLVKRRRATVADEESALPHWNVEPWAGNVSGADLLEHLMATFRRYIVLPKGAGEALALWTLHSWTMDAGDVSPFLVLDSPTKRCGKTSVLILLLYLTPRSELASNISPSALFRYVEDIRPTLLIDEADSFVVENEEMRGILNSGHTKAAAHVIRNVEINGEHKPRRFSTWAPKAIATIGALADTLEDRAVVVQLQRKSKTAKVARLRKRDCEDFATLRRKAARWAEVNFDALAADPDPNIPDELNDRAADNWRPLLAIADLVGGQWPQRAREAACLLSGEGHESISINVRLLADIHLAFGDNEAMRSADLVAALIADPERPWAEWKRGKPLTQKQLGGLLAPFCISSETVSIEGLNDAKGYKRVRFGEAWEAYVPAQKLGQNSFAHPIQHSEASKRRNADGTGVFSDFQSVAEAGGDGSKNDDLAHNHAGFDASTLRKSESEAKVSLTINGDEPSEPFPGVCEHCGVAERPGKPIQAYDVNGERYLLHPRCHGDWLAGPDPDGWTFNLDDGP